VSKFTCLAAPYVIRTDQKIGSVRLVFDIEADNLVDLATKAHCIVIADLDNDHVNCYGPDEIEAALEHLARADYIVGHNISGYDLPLLRRLYDWAPATGCSVMDTLVASRLILPHIDDLDDRAAAMGDPALEKLRGRYSLEAWGARLGIPKIGADIEDWSKWTPEMQERCAGDVAICKALWRFLQPDGYSKQAIELEHRVAVICNQITTAGVPFDIEAAERLRQQWTTRRAELEAQLLEQFPDTNLNSRAQIGVLLEARGWVPEKRTEKTGQPKIDDELLETLPELYPEFAGLSEHYMIGRRLGQLCRGKQAWLKHIGADGRIHGGLVHIGTPHSRSKHLNPNLAQVPNPKRGKPLATECRALFRAGNDWIFVACDQSNLQDRGYAHYLHAFDAGAYANAFLNGADTHWQSAAALGLVAQGAERDKQNKVHTTVREGAKRFRYAFLYGCGAETAGRIIHDAVRAVQQFDPANGLQQKFFGASARPSEAALKQVGKQALDRFEAGTPGLRRLRGSLKAHARRHGWLPGLDGRRVPVRALYSALNFIVTSSEAIICKRWLVRVHDELRARFRYGWDGDVVIALWVHDELVCCCRPEIAEQVGEIMVRHAKEPGEFYAFKVPLDAEYKIGRSWAGELPDGTQQNERHGSVGNGKDPAELNDDRKPDLVPDGLAAILAAADKNDRCYDRAGLHAGHAEDTEHVDRQAGQTSQDDDTADNTETGVSPEDDHVGNGHDQHAGAYPHGEQRTGRHVATYLYRDHLGRNHTMITKMAATKTRRAQYPQSFWVDGHWATKKPAGWLKVPYRLPELLAAIAAGADVFIPEGEKDCETLVELGLVATTSSEGATPPKAKTSNWTPELNKWFHGAQRAYILEDNDAPGRRFAREKTRTLRGIVPDIRIVSFPDVPDGEDVTYWLTELKHTKEELLARCEGTERWQGGGTLESIRADQVTMHAVHWLWGKRFAVGKIGIIAGLPDEGKGQILCYIAARSTYGLEWPNNEGICPRGNVVILSAEENPGDSLAPRLKAAGADLSRIHFINMVRDRDEKTGQERRRMFSLVSDLEKLRHKIMEVGDVVTVLIDPISAYLGIGAVDSYRDTDVRAVLGPLKDLAEELRVAIITVMHFNKKVDITNALLRVSNSMAFVGLPRHAYGVIADAENARKLLVRAKNNDAAEADNQTLAFHFDVREVGTDPDSGEPIRAPFIVWEPGYVDVTASEAMQAASEHKSPGERDKAKNLLLALLAEGREVFVDELKDTAEGHGISWRTMRRAGDDLKIVVGKERTAKGKWFWKLPQKED
jgi:DNA polymerase-1